jgi:hypothetical protein
VVVSVTPPVLCFQSVTIPSFGDIRVIWWVQEGFGYGLGTGAPADSKGILVLLLCAGQAMIVGMRRKSTLHRSKPNRGKMAMQLFAIIGLIAAFGFYVERMTSPTLWNQAYAEGHWVNDGHGHYSLRFYPRPN